MTFKQVVVRLDEANAIEDPLVFEWYGRYVGLSSQVQPGHYTIDPAWTQKEILEVITTRRVDTSVRVYIPAGWNRWQIADRLSEAGLINRKDFLNRVRMEGLEGQSSR